MARFNSVRRLEFEWRIVISFAIVAATVLAAHLAFSSRPALAVLVFRIPGASSEKSMAAGYLAVAVLMAMASFLRIWAGSILTSRRMMRFRVQTDDLLIAGPYWLVRNPIYLADLIAFSGFALCLPLIGLLLPALLYVHYSQIIRYEEQSLQARFGQEFGRYLRLVPRLLPGWRSFSNLPRALQRLEFSRDGLRHNSLYLLFIPGFIVAALRNNLFWAAAIGGSAVIDWVVVHTRIGFEKENARDRESDRKKSKGKKVFRDILYAQCWEDPQVDLEALRIGSDDEVFAITSGGCNVLALLLDDPKRVVSLDMNPHQNFLLELKIAAFRTLDWADVLKLLGIRPAADRLALYGRIRLLLSPGARDFWDARPRLFRQGIVHCGRYERYMRLLRKLVVRPLFPAAKIRLFFECADAGQRHELFQKKVNGLRWKLLTRVMLSRFLNTFLFDRVFFAQLDNSFSFGTHFARKAEQAFTRLPLKENYFLAYILFSGFPETFELPVYLRQENFALIRNRLDRIQIVTGSCQDYFAAVPDAYFSKFNFSNIFEWLSEVEFEQLLHQTLRVARDGAVMVYRNLLVHREHPPTLDSSIRSCHELADTLHIRDLSFIYDNYVVEEIHRGGQSWPC